MIFAHFETPCPEVGSKERYVLSVPEGITTSGRPMSIALFDYYCPLPDCDCRRVKVKFSDLATEPGAPPVASILYGWEPMRFYRDLDDDPKLCASLVNGMLDPYEELGPDSRKILRFFHCLARKEPLVSLLPRHYRLFKQAARRELDVDPSAKLFLPGREDSVMAEPWADGFNGGLGVVDLPPAMKPKRPPARGGNPPPPI
jgi:hypothetical protein